LGPFFSFFFLQPLIAGFILARMQTPTILFCVFVGRLIQKCFMSQLLAVLTVLLAKPSKHWLCCLCRGKSTGGMAMGDDKLLRLPTIATTTPTTAPTPASLAPTTPGDNLTASTRPVPARLLSS